METSAKKVEAEEAVRELTLALLFLNRWRKSEGKKNARKYWPWQTWKNYDFDTGWPIYVPRYRRSENVAE